MLLAVLLVAGLPARGASPFVATATAAQRDGRQVVQIAFKIPAGHISPQHRRLLLVGLESGRPIEINPEYWETKRRQLIERHNRKTTGPRSEDPCVVLPSAGRGFARRA